MSPPEGRHVSPRERRIVVTGLATIVAIWAVTRGVPAVWRSWQRHVDSVERLRMAVVRANRDIAAAPVVRESLAVVSSRLVAKAPQLFAGTSAAAASAALSSYVAGLAATAGVRIIRQDAGRDSTSGLFRQMVLHVEAESDVAGIGSWLARLEEGHPLVGVSQLTISALEPGAPPGQAERLRVDVVLLAWSTTSGARDRRS